MTAGIYLGFDFGYKNIGVAVGEQITHTARPLATITAKAGVPDWALVQKVITTWQPLALIVGLPKYVDGTEQYTTSAARNFAAQLKKRFALPVHLVDERLSTKEARSKLFASGGYRKIQKSQVDGFAACIILEQWLLSAV